MTFQFDPFKRLLFALALLLSLPLAANGQSSDLYFKHIDSDNGLSHNLVKSIMQDELGFMWFGTANKLNRYDGISVKVYDCIDPLENKADNNIGVLFESLEEDRFWIGTDNGIFFFDPQKEQFSYCTLVSKEGISMSDWVADIKADSYGNIWVIIPNQGVFRYHIKSQQLHYYFRGSSHAPNHGNPQSLCIENNGRVWIGSNSEGIYLYNRESDDFETFLGNNNGQKTLSGQNIYTLCDYGEYLLVGIHEGEILKFDKKKNTLENLSCRMADYKIIRDIVVSDTHDIWIGTDAGLYIFNEQTKHYQVCKEDPTNDYSLSDNRIGKIYTDRENGTWIATFAAGINYLPYKKNLFQYFIPGRTNNSISGKQIREMTEDSHGNIWIGTEDEGLSLFNPQSQEFKKLGKNFGSSPFYNKTMGIRLINDKMWVGYFKNGLDIYDQKTGKSRHYTGEELGLNESSVSAIYEDKYETIWIGNCWGVFSAAKGEMKFVQRKEFGYGFIYYFMEDSQNNLWAVSMGNGVFKYNPHQKKVKHYTHQDNNPASLSSNSVSNIMEDSKGNLWLSTDRGGLCKYDRKSDSFTTYSSDKGLPDVAYKVLEDKNGYLWYGSNIGLVRFHPEKGESKIYNKNNGLLSNQFNYNSAIASKNGRFYFGSLQGLISVDPYDLTSNKFPPPIYITKLLINNKEITPYSEESPLVEEIIFTREITLSYDQSNIGFEFVSLSYKAPGNNQYAYKMEGIDNDWIYTSTQRSTSYTKLPPGKYKFTVKGTNNDGLWNNEGASISIKILPPWYASSWAFITYIFLIGGGFYIGVTLYTNSLNRKNVEKQQLYEAQKEQEVYKTKIDFFTNIAHEIRTPLTLINGPLESLEELDIQEPKIRKNLNIMRKSTAQLLALINQLLDFRKVDDNKYIFAPVCIPFGQFLLPITEQFSTLIQQKNIRLELLQSSDKEIYIKADKDGLQKILNNILSNAIKYCSAQITIDYTLQKEYMTLSIKNDGPIIPAHEIEKIFDPFYRISNTNSTPIGSGLGLSLARSLAEMQGGSLWFEAIGGLNAFLLKLPLDKTIPSEKENDPLLAEEKNYIIEEAVIGNEKEKKYTLLVVEDNIEMQTFLCEKLSRLFSVQKATNGIQALDILQEHHIDLILTDVMMDQMDGFELCKSVKTNIEYSHIPLIFITAKNDIKSKIEGLEIGADAYIEKPFTFSYLTTQIKTLLSNRQLEREAFSRNPALAVQNIGLNRADEIFLDKTVRMIYENITESAFGIEKMAEMTFMSRSSLHRKIKALTGLTPTDYLRLIRLKKAAELIQQGDYRVGEICFLVGINSPSYFTKVFQKQFGMNPKEYEKHIKG